MWQRICSVRTDSWYRVDCPRCKGTSQGVEGMYVCGVCAGLGSVWTKGHEMLVKRAPRYVTTCEYPEGCHPEPVDCWYRRTGCASGCDQFLSAAELQARELSLAQETARIERCWQDIRESVNY